MVRRSRLDIVADMLSSLSDNGGKLKPTRLMYKSNLSHPQMKGYLDELYGKGFVEDVFERKQRYVWITPAGRRFREKLEEIRRFEEGFGL